MWIPVWVKERWKRGRLERTGEQATQYLYPSADSGPHPGRFLILTVRQTEGPTLARYRGKRVVRYITLCCLHERVALEGCYFSISRVLLTVRSRGVSFDWSSDLTNLQVRPITNLITNLSMIVKASVYGVTPGRYGTERGSR